MIQTAAIDDNVFYLYYKFGTRYAQLFKVSEFTSKIFAGYKHTPSYKGIYIYKSENEIAKNIVHTYTYVHIMQISVPDVSVITKVCDGYNRGMLSAVKSCGQS